jgi:hypothetical protein
MWATHASHAVRPTSPRDPFGGLTHQSARWPTEFQWANGQLRGLTHQMPQGDGVDEMVRRGAAVLTIVGGRLGWAGDRPWAAGWGLSVGSGTLKGDE